MAIFFFFGGGVDQIYVFKSKKAPLLQIVGGKRMKINFVDLKMDHSKSRNIQCVTFKGSGIERLKSKMTFKIVPTFQNSPNYIFQFLNGKYKVASILVNVQMVGLQGWYV